MTTRHRDGRRVYELLIPVTLPPKAPTPAGQPETPPTTVTHITIHPMTFLQERDWEAGQTYHPRGYLYRLLTLLCAADLEAINRMVQPDSSLFLEDFMLSLPPRVREGLATGNVPVPEVPPEIAAGRAPAPFSADPSQPPPLAPDGSDWPPAAEEIIEEPEPGYVPEMAGIDDGAGPAPPSAFGVDLR